MNVNNGRGEGKRGKQGEIRDFLGMHVCRMD